MLKGKDSFVWRRNVYYRRDAATLRKEKLLLEFKTVILDSLKLNGLSLFSLSRRVSAVKNKSLHCNILLPTYLLLLTFAMLYPCEII